MSKELLSGILLMLAAILAIVVANSPLHGVYNLMIEIPFTVKLGDWGLSKPLLLWINDGLMALFFFQIGLELKKEFLEGELANPKNLVLPLIGALGGMIVPGAIYFAINHADEVAVKGWAIPAATDIAFALGVLAVLGNRVPPALKIFLASLAIFDDMGAIVIIALFYTSKISLFSLLIVAASIVALFLVNRRNVQSRIPYIVLGLIMWHAMLKSGVHATLAGVILAMFIPAKAEPGKESLLNDMDHAIHPWIMYLVLPVFAFANSGIRLVGISWDQAFHSVPIGIAAGLFFGKQLGVFSFSWIAIRAKWALLPKGATWRSLYGVSVLCGIGFTMSLFIGSLAFEATGENAMFDERLGILIGSAMSGVLGYWILKRSVPNP